MKNKIYDQIAQIEREIAMLPEGGIAKKQSKVKTIIITGSHATV